MSYVQIKAGGKLRGMKFNQLTLITMSTYQDAANEIATAPYALFYAGLYSNCYVKREEPDFDFEKSCEWFDELSKEDIDKITKAFNESISFQKDLPKEEKKRIATKDTGKDA